VIGGCCVKGSGTVRERHGRAGWAVRGLAAGLILLVAVACSGSSDAPKPTPTPAPTASPVPSPIPSPVASPSPLPDLAATPGVFTSAQADVGKVVWSTSLDPATNAPTHRVTALTANVTTIFATLPVYRVKPGTVFTAKWTYNNTPVEALTSHVTAGGSYAEAWIEFHITRAANQPWPAGTYEVTVLVGDQQQVAEQATVRVRDGQGS
jgi:hypothetical protein